MLQPLAMLGLVPGLIASPAAQAQTAPARGDCMPSGMVLLSALNLRATQPLRIASVSLRTGGMFSPGIEVELPVGQEVRVGLGRRSGPRLSDSELRSGLRVTCIPA